MLFDYLHIPILYYTSLALWHFPRTAMLKGKECLLFDHSSKYVCKISMMHVAEV